MRNPKIAVSYGRYSSGNQRFAEVIRQTAREALAVAINTRIFVPVTMPAPRLSRYQRTLIEAGAAAEAASGGVVCTTCTAQS